MGMYSGHKNTLKFVGSLFQHIFSAGQQLTGRHFSYFHAARTFAQTLHHVTVSATSAR